MLVVSPFMLGVCCAVLAFSRGFSASLAAIIASLVASIGAWCYGLHNSLYETIFVFMLALALAVLPYRSGSQFCFTAELQPPWLVTCAIEEEDPHHPNPHWSSGVEIWSDMSNEEEYPHLHPPTPIGHQELRVEVTWAMRRSTPTITHPPPLVIRSRELKWHEQWGGVPTLPSHWSSGVEIWSDMSNEEEHPTLSPHWSSGVES